MTWSYSGDPNNSELDFYRFSVGDTVEYDGILQDEEIQFILDKYSDHDERMYLLFDTIASLLARRIKRSLGPQSEDPTSLLNHYKAKRDEYRRKLSTPGLYVPYSRKAFWKGMHDNV